MLRMSRLWLTPTSCVVTLLMIDSCYSLDQWSDAVQLNCTQLRQNDTARECIQLADASNLCFPLQVGLPVIYFVGAVHHTLRHTECHEGFSLVSTSAALFWHCSRSRLP